MNKGVADFGRAFRSTLISGVAYTCALQHQEESDRALTEARSSHSHCILQQYILYGQSGCKQLGFVLRNFAKETFRKGGDNLFRWQLP